MINLKSPMDVMALYRTRDGDTATKGVRLFCGGVETSLYGNTDRILDCELWKHSVVTIAIRFTRPVDAWPGMQPPIPSPREVATLDIVHVPRKSYFRDPEVEMLATSPHRLLEAVRAAGGTAKWLWPLSGGDFCLASHDEEWLARNHEVWIGVEFRRGHSDWPSPKDQPVVSPPRAELLERLARLEAELIALRLAMVEVAPRLDAAALDGSRGNS